MVEIVVSKTIHAYFGAKQDLFKQNTVKRKGTDSTTGAFRPVLSAKCDTGRDSTDDKKQKLM